MLPPFGMLLQVIEDKVTKGQRARLFWRER
jgi:hypothetical protein